MNYTGKSAEISECGQYRYFLSRWWNARMGGRLCVFIGVNPSTADASEDDATIRKMVGFAARWGFDGIAVGNLFAHRATDVRELATAMNPIGPDNDGWLLDMMNLANLVVPCWGSSDKLPKELRSRIAEVSAVISQTATPVKCLGYTASGDPKHPLMLGYVNELADFAKRSKP
jgi:hypothetical protein